MLIVMKFGGTSVGDGSRIAKAAELAHREIAKGHQVVVVSSAMSGVTNTLIDAARAAARGDESPTVDARRRLFAQHIGAITAIAPQRATQDKLIAEIDRELTVFENLARSVHILGELTARGLDAIAPRGEIMLVPILAQALRERGLRAEPIIATELIVTDNVFGNASPLMTDTTARARERLLPLLAAGAVPVVTGFIGATAGGIMTTLGGRGGSDYTATVLGAALDADEVWIWTDVNGVMSADPRVVPNAHTLPEISYAEAAELSYFGAKVLHPKTIVPIAGKKKPVRILNTFEPDHPGTAIVPQARAGARTVKAITAIKNLCILSLEGSGMAGVPGVAAKLFGAVAREGVSVMMIAQSSSELDICIVIEEAAAGRAVEAIEREFELERMRGNIDGVRAEHDVTIVAVVGAGLRETPGIAARVFGVLAGRGINIISIAQGSSEYNLSLVVKNERANDSLRAIHEAFELEQA